MLHSSLSGRRLGVLITLFSLAVVTALVLMPYRFTSEAGAKKGDGLFPITKSHVEGLDFYDVRTEESKEAGQILLDFRQRSGKDASFIADQTESFVRAEESLRTNVPTLKIDYNRELRAPGTIGTDVFGPRSFLTSPSGAKRSDLLRSFARQNNELIGMTDGQIDNLQVQVDYTNPDGNLSWVILEQFIGDVPVYRGELKGGFTKQGQIFRVQNNLAPGLEYESISREFGGAVDAVRNAARHINHELRSWETTPNETRSNDLKVTFGGGDFPTTAQKIYFPLESGIAVPAWRVVIITDVPAFEVIVDADGTMLRRDNLVKDQTQSVTYRVWNNTTSALKAADNPAPLTPGPLDPTLGTQGTSLARSTVALIGNEAPYAFNNNGWITDGQNTTSGNNVNAGLDRQAPDGVDSPATGSGTRVFDFAANPPPGNPGPGDDPLPAGQTATPCAPALPTPAPAIDDKQRAAVTQMFYVVNRLHDETYRRGFVEQARNFQVDNFGRGGTGGDPIQAQGQDCSGTNNANFLSDSVDGGPSRMQMYLWTPPTPDRDGTTDAEIVVHEIGHGITNRLHTLGIGGTQGGQMHEGNGDFLAHLLLAEASDPINGVYTTGGYSTLNLRATAPFSNTGNYYYGIRRFPKSVIAFTGGTASNPHNPLTYGDIDPAQHNVTNGAFGAAFTGSATAVHDGGEIWSSMLWEVRGILVARLGFEAGTAKMLQLMLDGMKSAGANPTMLQQRNNILAAALAGPTPGPDAADVREGFRRRGMGFSSLNNAGNTVVEAFDVPNVQVVDPFTVSDSPGDNDGFPEPGENLILNVSVRNPGTGATINNVQVNINGGPNVSFGNITDAATVTNPVAYTVPADAVCGSMHQVTINVSSGIGAGLPAVRSFRLGAPVGGAPTTVSNNTALVIPGSGTGPGVSAPYGTTVNVAGLTGNKVVRLTLNGFGHTFPADVDVLLVGPAGQKFIAMSDAANSLDASGATINLVDSAATVIPVADTAISGTWRPTNHPVAADPFTTPAPAGPYESPAPGGSATFSSVFGTAGSALNGTWTLYVMDDAGVDTGSMTGWSLTFEANDYACQVTAGDRAPFDFDGDNKTDVSIYRPGVGEWWYLKSSDGSNAAAAFGNSTDRIVPADYTGDLKADIAIFRPSSGEWFVLRSENNTFYSFPFGTSTDVPVPADYDNDGKADAAVYRPSTSTWFVNQSGGGTLITAFGAAGDLPVAADYDGDGKADMAIFRPSLGQWWLNRTTAGVIALNFGASGDQIVPGDYTGDGKADVAYFRAGTWFVLRSEDFSFYSAPFGTGTDTPSPGDYDGDGKFDFAVFRQSAGTWFVNRSTGGTSIVPFGINTDVAVPNAYVR